MEDRPDEGVVQSQDIDVSDQNEDSTVVIKNAQIVFGEHPAYGLLVQC
jgi:hypothetical protein